MLTDFERFLAARTEAIDMARKGEGESVSVYDIHDHAKNFVFGFSEGREAEFREKLEAYLSLRDALASAMRAEATAKWDEIWRKGMETHTWE